MTAFAMFFVGIAEAGLGRMIGSPFGPGVVWIDDSNPPELPAPGGPPGIRAGPRIDTRIPKAPSPFTSRRRCPGAPRSMAQA